MDIKELKQRIENKTLDNKTLIFKYNNSKYLCEHYINEIAKAKNLQKIYINSLNELDQGNDFFEDIESSYLYVYEVDELTELNTLFDNLIIICKKVFKDSPIDYIEFQDVQNWQIEDFMKFRMPGLEEEQIKWLCEICKYDYYRLNNECKKLEIFSDKMQSILLREMIDENTFSDLNNLTIMNLTNAIMQKDLITINNIISDLQNIDIEATGLITLLLRQFKSNIEVTFNEKWNDTLSCSEKQFKYLKWKPNTNYNANQMLNIYEFLTQQDMRLKKGEVTFKNDNRPNNSSYVYYIINNVLTLANK